MIYTVIPHRRSSFHLSTIELGVGRAPRTAHSHRRGLRLSPHPHKARDERSPLWPQWAAAWPLRAPSSGRRSYPSDLLYSHNHAHNEPMAWLPAATKTCSAVESATVSVGRARYPWGEPQGPVTTQYACPVPQFARLHNVRAITELLAAEAARFAASWDSHCLLRLTSHHAMPSYDATRPWPRHGLSL